LAARVEARSLNKWRYEQVKLSKTERWILANQHRILEALYPQEAPFFAETREALESGYELHYDPDYIDNDTLSEEECREVLEILDMHRALHFSYAALGDKSGLELERVRFLGFDGNEETKYMAYCRYFCRHDGGRFPELDRRDDFNSHFPMLDRYRRMLDQWRNLDKSHELTKADILKIVSG